MATTAQSPAGDCAGEEMLEDNDIPFIILR
jgi:hypothetical protein